MTEGWHCSHLSLVCRIEETNTMSLGGLAGASNTLGSALYFVDYSLSMLRVRTE